MSRSPRIRSLTLAAALLTLVSFPAQAQPRGESMASIVTRVWQGLLDALPAFAKTSASAPASTVPGDPNGGDRGADLDPDGLATDNDRSASLDPNG